MNLMLVTVLLAACIGVGLLLTSLLAARAELQRLREDRFRVRVQFERPGVKAALRREGVDVEEIKRRLDDKDASGQKEGGS